MPWNATSTGSSFGRYLYLRHHHQDAWYKRNSAPQQARKGLHASQQLASNHNADLTQLQDEVVRAHAALVAVMAIQSQNLHNNELPAFWDSWLYQSSTRPYWPLGPPSASKEPVRYCLLLTASTKVHVELSHYAWGVNQQRNGSRRQAMYRQNLRAWLQTRPEMPIVLVDSTDDDSYINDLRNELSDEASPFFASVSKEARERVELHAVRPSQTCTHKEIGCHEASAILSAMQRSRFFRRRGDGRQPMCTHAVKVTGRYHVPALGRTIARCPNGVGLVVESSGSPVNNPAFPRQETMVLGFDTRWAEALFGWSQDGGVCQECHIGDMVKAIQALRARDITPARGAKSRTWSWKTQWVRDMLCVLPPMKLSNPTREGSTGILRTHV